MKINFTPILKGTVVIAIVFPLFFSSCGKKEAAAPPPAKVKVVDVLQTTVPIPVDFVGQTSGYQDIPIRARVDGFLTGMYFTEGSTVKRGQLLYTIDPDPLQAIVANKLSGLAMISLISDVTSLYFQLLDYDNRLEISRSTLVIRQEYLNIIQERFNKGTVPEIDLNQAQIQEAIAAVAIPQYVRAVANVENALSILLGRNPGPILRGATLANQVMPPDIPPGLPSDMLQRRPDILQAEQIVASQNAMIGVAQAMRFPTFNLTALFGVASYLEVLDSERTLFEVSLNASATLQFRLNSYVNLYKVLGGGWVSQEEKKAAGQ